MMMMMSRFLAIVALLLMSASSSSSSGAGGGGGLRLNYYSESCPRAEEVVREEVQRLYEEHGNTAVSWVRALFHDCMVKSCDASLLLETTPSGGLVTKQASRRNFGKRNFKYITAIKAAVERECPATVSCTDILTLAARDGVAMLGGPSPVSMRTGQHDSRESYYGMVEQYIPNHNNSVLTVLSRFTAMDVGTERVVVLLGAHLVGRVHCFNLVRRLYSEVDGSMEAAYGEYLRGRSVANLEF